MSQLPPSTFFDAARSILLDRLGAAPAAVLPHAEGEPVVGGLVLDLGGRVNKSTDREERRYLLTALQAAELVAELATAGHRVAGDAFYEEFSARLRALSGEGERP